MPGPFLMVAILKCLSPPAVLICNVIDTNALVWMLQFVQVTLVYYWSAINPGDVFECSSGDRDLI